MSTTSSSLPDLPHVQKAVFTTTHPGPIEIRERPVPQQAGEGEVLVKIKSTALNPYEVHISSVGWSFVQIFPACPPSERPIVLGHDFAGEVVRVGKDVDGLEIGDRVVGCGSLGADDTQAFQSYALIPAYFATRIPRQVSFETASTIPMGLNTASAGIYLFGGLTAPWEEGGKGKYEGQACVIGGGSGSVGQFAIQLAKLSGFSPIIATASPQHTSILLALGATHVVGHTTSSSTFASLAGENPITMYFLSRTTAETIPGAVETLAPGGLLVTTTPALLESTTKPLAAAAGKNIKAVASMASPYRPTSMSFGKGMYKALEGMLERGEIRGNDFEVLGGGLGAVEEGLKRVKEGNAGKKLVVRPEETQ